MTIKKWTLSKICIFISYILLCERHYTSQARVIGNFTSIIQNENSNLFWELVEVEFKTQIRNEEDVIESDYHIIEIKGTSNNSTMVLHVTKKALTTSDFTFLVTNGDSKSKVYKNFKVDCLYSGIVASDPDGKTAISTCGEPSELSGMIMKSDGHWMIEPHPVSIHELGRTMDVSRPHRLRRSTPENSGNASSLPSDELHVPKDKLEAAAQSELDRKAANKEEHPQNKKLLDVIDGNDDSGTPLELLKMAEDDEDIIQFEPLAKKKPKSKKEASTSASVVELAVFTDPDFYNEMKVRYPKNTNTKIREYVLTLVNAMDMLYEQKSLGNELIFKLVRLEIMQKWPSKLKKNGKSAKDFLTSFCEYAGGLNINNALWDHGLFLTGSDLKENGSSATAGLAWAGTMCFRYYSCSVSEALQLGSVYVIAHELGHSMGMDHDGSGTCKACDANKFLMSPTTGSGKVTWSTCSSKNLKDFIKDGSPDLKGSKTTSLPTCLTTTSRESEEITYKDKTLPGQKFDASKQCQLAHGKKFTPHMTNESPYNNICDMLFCSNTTHAVSSHAALEGTACASGKICRVGVCVKKS